MTSISTNEYKTAGRNLDIILNEMKDTINSLELLSLENLPSKEEKISSLKKQIKHCKNHMERKKLEQKLNSLYKERKAGK